MAARQYVCKLGVNAILVTAERATLFCWLQGGCATLSM
jgi:hypothetical protein